MGAILPTKCHVALALNVTSMENPRVIYLNAKLYSSYLSTFYNGKALCITWAFIRGELGVGCCHGLKPTYGFPIIHITKLLLHLLPFGRIFYGQLGYPN